MKYDPLTGIWTEEVAQYRHRTDFALAAAIGTYFEPQESTADVGCGMGVYCKILTAYGWRNVWGYEGTRVDKMSDAYPKIYFVDLTLRVEIARPFACVLCLEVGEHVPERHEAMFLENLRRMTKGTLILSWAHPGQGGTGHVNEKSEGYVRAKFEENGLKVDDVATAFLRKRALFRYFRHNVIVMRSEI